MTSSPYEDEAQARRLAGIFGTQEVPAVDTDSLTVFAVALNKRLTFPCPVAAVEAFDWEDPFLDEQADQDAFDRLRTDNPSYLDTFVLVAVEPVPDPINGLMARITRRSDGRRFVVPLENIEAEQNDAEAYTLLKDYAVWHILQG